MILKRLRMTECKFGILLVLICIGISAQSIDVDNDLQDEGFDGIDNESKMVLTQEESDLYDRNKDGTLDHKEMARYLQDVLARQNSEPIKKKNIAPWSLPKVFGRFTLKEAGIVLILCMVSIGLVYRILFSKKSQSRTTGVQIENIRVARLKKLQEFHQRTSIQPITQNSSLQIACTKTEKVENSTPDDDFETLTYPHQNAKKKHSQITTQEIKAPTQTQPVIKLKKREGKVALDETAKTHDQTENPVIKSSKESTIKNTSFNKVVEVMLSQVLDCKFELLSTPSKTTNMPLSSNTTPIIMVLQTEDIPVDIDAIKKVSKIVSKRMYLDLEPMKCAIKCYDRCLQITDPSFKNKIDVWKALTSLVKHDCADVVLQELVKATTSPTSVEEDLWSDLNNSSPHQGLSLYFLNCLVGWSCDGAVASSELLKKVLEKAKDDSTAKETFVNMVVLLGRHIKLIGRLDEIALQCSSLLKGIEILINQPVMIDFLSEEFIKEVQESSTRLGRFYHEKSLFSAFLSLTTLEAKVTGKSQASKPFLSLPNFPRSSPDDIKRVQSQLQDGFHSCQSVVYSILRKVLAKYPQSALAWIASVVADNDIRSKALLSENPDESIACDGYMMNFCHVLLRLCEPFFVNKGETKIANIATGYCLSDACRLNHNNERTLSGSCIENEEIESSTNFILPDGLKGTFILKTEMFHMTQRALHIGLVNTIQHHNRLFRQYLVLKEMNEGKEEEYVQKVISMFVFQWRTVLEDEEFMRLCCEFYLTSAFWLSKALENCERSPTGEKLCDDEVKKNQKGLLSAIPEFYVKDMCTWFYYVAVNGPHVLRNLKIIHFVDCCAMIMSSKGFVPGPMVSSKIVTALLSFADSCNRNKNKDSLLETASWGSGVEGCLTAAVVVSPIIREKLASALIQTYTSVDVVEGLDVDKEEFDKFTSRSEVIKLLQFLWKYPESRAVLKKKCENSEVDGFLSSVLDSLLYLLNDGLSRLANVSKLQKSIEDESKWEEMDLQEQKQKTTFLKNEEHVSKSFMLMANTTLSFLALITQESEVARCFCRKPLSHRAASAIIGFLNSLCGPRRVDLKVKNMERYSFNPRDLLGKLSTVFSCIASSDHKTVERQFGRDMATDPDFSKPIVEQAVRTLTRHDLVSPETIAELEVFINRCELHEEMELSESSRDQTPPEKNPSEQDDEEFERLYVEKFNDERHGTCQLLEVTAFQSFRSQPVNQRCSKIRALMREITQLKDCLPIHANSSIFVRQDEERMDFARTLITGPVDTPYSRGCFVFDVYFPSNYPNVPPLVKLITTGNGTVRFNPNLYADGKVCLSLLGTWHGGDSSEKWNPKTSSLYQVLLSIQGMILIPDPCFNEPGYESIRGTDDGNELSHKYNATIRLSTIRHAILAQIRYPPAGFEDVVLTHFRLQKEYILRQVYEWLQQCREPDEERRMLRDIEELKVELHKL